MIDLKAAVLRGRDALEAADGKFDHYDRNAYGNASEIAGCLRKQWYARNLDDQPEQDWGYARRGTHMERYVIDSLRAANLIMEGDDAARQISIQNDDLMLSCNLDLLVYDTEAEEWIAVEIKSIDPRVRETSIPKPGHVTQLDIGMGLYNKQAPDGQRILRGILLYMDASNYNIMHQFEVRHDPRILEKMARRAKQMLRARSADPLDREGIKSGECRYCPFKQVCGVSSEEPINQTGPRRGNRGSRLHAVLSDYEETKQLIDQAKGQLDAAKASIMAELEQRGTTEMKVGEFVVSLKAVAGRTTYDTKAAIADGVDLSAYKKTGAPSTRLDVTRSNAA